MKITALLTARGNNTLKDKNILNIAGHPTLYYIANAGKNTPEITSYFCSSDDEDILEHAAKIGYQKIVRPLTCIKMEEN